MAATKKTTTKAATKKAATTKKSNAGSKSKNDKMTGPIFARTVDPDEVEWVNRPLKK